MPDKPSPQPLPMSPRKMLALVMGGLLLWGIYVAAGAFWYGRSPWEAVIIMVCVGMFLGFWLLLLWSQGKKKQE